ncbi:MAG: tRNA-specific adenosine deaminase [Pseudomonadota bacterium]
MAEIDRRQAIRLASATATSLILPAAACAQEARAADAFMAEAFQLRDQALAAGDQPYGAALVLDGQIVGRGASRVVSDRNLDAHAERVALWAAQKALGRQHLDGAVIYSSSVPCAACQRALAEARVARMVHGRALTDAGAPKG